MFDNHLAFWYTILKEIEMYAPFVGGSFPQLASNLISLLCQTLAIGMSTKVAFDWENVSKYKSKTVYSKE